MFFAKNWGIDIRHVHFSDNRGRDDNHMPLGVGNINWKNAVKSLKSIGYDDTITLEVFCDDAAMLLQIPGSQPQAGAGSVECVVLLCQFYLCISPLL